MKAVVFGAGNIGRGFVGALFSKSGYEVCFVDVDVPLVDALNVRQTYPVRVVSNQSHEDMWIDNIRAVNGTDFDAVVDEIASADLMATAVGSNVLGKIAPTIAAGIRRRCNLKKQPLNIIICENLMDADKELKKLLRDSLGKEESACIETHVGLVQASIGRMVPIQTETMKSGDALRICVERYDYLPVDKDAFRGKIPDVEGMIPFTPFDFYVKRKLYIHNMGHATCAYLGLFCGKEYIVEAVADAEILLITQNAMLQSAEALSMKYDIPYLNIKRHIDDLLRRFSNAALGDTCARVGADPARKLLHEDRLIGAALCCLEQNITPIYICVSIACAIYEYLRETGCTQGEANASKVLSEVSGVADDAILRPIILRYYAMFCDGLSLSLIRKAASAEQAVLTLDVI